MLNTVSVTLLAMLLRWCVSLHPYSGAGKPPMYGDYEAQRHWQEVTVNLPLKDWYFNTTDNDLMYWGLDYPPLTAYHSYLCGLVARNLDPRFVALHESRGFESPEHKLFMRYTVFIMDLLVYFPAAYCLMQALITTSPKRRGGRLEFAALLLYPGIYLVDYGHFQYNNASLGLFMGAVAALLVGRDCLGSVLFCLALNYKQMELYHALPIFFYLLGVCFKQSGVGGFLWKITKVGFCVILTFAVVWLPFASDATVLTQVVRRLFPFDRGLFEDKVASIWCSISVLVKVKQLLDNGTIALVCLLTTAVCLLPSCLHLFSRPTTKHLRYGLINGSLIFFLLSYHVHEKSILLVAVPACLVISEEPFMVCWFLTVSTVSMLPLMVKDSLTVPLLVLTIFFLLTISLSHVDSSPTKWFSKNPYWVWMKRTFYLSLVGLLFLTVVTLSVPPPARLPDLFPVLLSIYCCGHFIFFGLYFHHCQFTIKDNRSAASGKLKVK